jgi:hypothetical protein
MPAGILEVIFLVKSKNPLPGRCRQRVWKIVFTPDYTIIPPPVW